MKVKIENYQSLKDVEFEVKGLTVITGQNNTGKSACARALCGVFSNARGHSHVRIGEKHSTVKVEFEDSGSVEWRKGKGVNSYTINGNLIDKVGSSVPDEVKKLGVVSVDVSGKEVWPQVSKQFEQVFLLDLPPNVLSSALSDVDKIQALEKASGLARSDIKALKSKAKFKREDLQEEKEKLEGFEGIEEATNLVREVEELEAQIAQNETEILSLEKVEKYRQQWINDINSLEDASNVYLPQIDPSSFNDLEFLEIQSKERNKASIKVMIIGVGLDSFPDLPEMPNDNDLRNYEKVHKKVLDLKEKISCIEPLLNISIPEVATRDEDLSEATKRRAMQEEVNKVTQEIADLTRDLETLKGEIKGDCPLCGTDLTHSH